MPGKREPYGLDQDRESLWTGEHRADASEGQSMVDAAHHRSRPKGNGEDRWENRNRVQRAAGEPDKPREKIGRRHFRTASARSQKHYSLQEHPSEAAGVGAERRE